MFNFLTRGAQTFAFHCTDTHPGIGSVLGIGQYTEPRYRYRQGEKGIGTSLVSATGGNRDSQAQ